MTIDEVRSKYLEFCKNKGHSIIPSTSLVPENDPTTLFTGSGMQPLLPYLLGQSHPAGKRIADSQKCFRAEDIEEIGDNRHTTFFEMLGNWSLGDYFKEEQLSWFFEFLTEIIRLDPNKLYVTVFSGDATYKIPKDTESVAIWKKLFKEKDIEATDIELLTEERGGKLGMQSGRIFYYDAEKNWWSRAGVPESMPAGEPGGPDSEVFYDFGTEHDPAYGEHCHPNCDCGRFLEIGNSVFMQYIRNKDGSFSELPQKNVDFGGGLERITAASLHNPDVFAINVFKPLIQEIEKVTGTTYSEKKYEYRIILDHMRAAVFLLADGVKPSNKDQGYFVRRLIRRAILKANTLSHPQFITLGVSANIFADVYEKQYPLLRDKVTEIEKDVTEEETNFRITLEKGLREFEKAAAHKNISGETAFTLFTTYGFPIELTVELAAEKGITVNIDEFKKYMKQHRELSRAGAEKKFKGGLADGGEMTTKLHTATHLMLAGLRKHLGDHVHQAGSNITAERTRFDFTHPEKVDRGTLDKVEEYVNTAINANAEVQVVQIPKEKAKAAGVEGSFWEKYPDVVDVYTIVDSRGTVYSRELCGGPHVESTKNMGVFKIQKEESSAAGVRRIKAILE